MTVFDLVFGIGYSFFALLSALGVVLFVAVLLDAERYHGRWAQVAIIPIIALGTSVSTLMSGRNLQNAATDMTLGVDGASGSSSLLLRFLTLAILGICLARIAGQCMHRREAAADGTALFVAFTLFFVTHTVLNSIFGAYPVLIHNIFYAIVPFATIYAARRESLTDTISLAKIALFGIIFCSLVMAIVKPNLAIEPGYKGWIPGLTFRLWGIGSNANSIGPLALVALLVEYMQPCSKRWMHWLVQLMSLLVFVLAQSKTVWVVLVVLLPVLGWYRMTRSRRGIDIRMVFSLIVLASLALFCMLFLDPADLLAKIFSTKESSQITTLTGRNRIWTVAFHEWLNHPLFGYGPDIWGPAYRAHIGMPFATSAHNQFLQSLSAAGALGLITLLMYLWLLGYHAFRTASATRGVSAALLTLVLLRCMTETPLTLSTLFNGDFLTQILLFAICMNRFDTPVSTGVPKNLA